MFLANDILLPPLFSLTAPEPNPWECVVGSGTEEQLKGVGEQLSQALVLHSFYNDFTP
jgi:hypothetical protein